MQPYQSYYPINNYPQYSNYQNFNNFQDRYTPTQPTIVGKVINDFSLITANDVPLDGNAATFIKADGSEIQLRAWKPDGTIATTRFKPILEDKVMNDIPNEQNSFYEEFKQFKTDIFDRLDRLDKTKTTRTKKEVEDNA